ncbi:MAG TPA: hydrogenase [Candidatus Omnitrophota bacterium]|jgi:hydrogenase-4 component E|nr:MAG: hydrogenase 4 membrane subunit [Candidatus Omnitrophica bacterium ADurb.Bin314]HOE68957.1 hydrogenase [Candidatus Omnitrophota bacterium]HQB93895.1 hydrogenase [Candidatus Omnitrophota bacterium]
MTPWIDVICILAVFLSLTLLATHRIVGMIKIFAVQSFFLGLVPLFLHGGIIAGRDLAVSLVTMVLKAGLVPAVLFWELRHISMRSEVRPILGLGASILCGAVLIAVAFWISLAMKLPGKLESSLVLPCSLATILLGFMTMVTRTRAVTQVLGYMVIENGIFLFALSLFDTMPVPIEMGILLDIFVAVFVMAIVLNHINEEFERTRSTGRRPRWGES